MRGPRKFTAAQVKLMEEAVTTAKIQGMLEGRQAAEAAAKAATRDRDRERYLTESDHRYKAIGAMAHAMKAMADILVREF